MQIEKDHVPILSRDSSSAHDSDLVLRQKSSIDFYIVLTDLFSEVFDVRVKEGVELPIDHDVDESGLEWWRVAKKEHLGGTKM